jgi:LPS sulfotransferase NodH
LKGLSVHLRKRFRAVSAAVYRNPTTTNDSGERFPLPYEPSKHEKKVLAYFEEDDARAVLSADFQIDHSVFICFTNRCGSNFVAEQLASTRKLPRAHESFNWPQAISFSERNEAKSFRHFCQLLIERYSKNGVYASKVGWSQLYFLCRSKVIPEIFGMPRFIYVRRRDLLGQAISFVIAKQTGVWSSKMVSDAKPRYDAAAIAARLESIARANARFEVLFAHFGFPVFEIVYEDFLEQGDRCVSAVTEWLGLGPSTINDRGARLQVQRNAVNDEWRDRFLSEQQEFFASRSGRRGEGA